MPMAISVLIQVSMNSHFKSFYNFLLWIYLFRNERKLEGKLLCKCTQNATHHHNVFFFWQKGSERGLSPTGTNPLIMFCLFNILSSSHFLFQEGLIISIGCIRNITISLLGLWQCDCPACPNCYILLCTEILKNKSSILFFVFLFYVFINYKL